MRAGTGFGEVLLLLTIGGGMLIGLVAIIGGFLHHRRERLLTHAERLKALELGRSLPDDSYAARLRAVWNGQGSQGKRDDGTPTDPDRALVRKCYSLALWVAFWGFLFGAPIGAQSTAALVALVASVGAIGVTSVICGTVLASRVAARPPVDHTANGKPAFEGDAYDHVGMRG